MTATCSTSVAVNSQVAQPAAHGQLALCGSAAGGGPLLAGLQRRVPAFR